jgi:hypothetical protein
MAPANVIPLVADTSVTGIRATIDALLNARRTFERAVVDLGRARGRRITELIDALAFAAAKGGFGGPDAIKVQQELETVRKSFNDQEAALHYCEREVNERLTGLAADFLNEVLEAVDVQIATLKRQESIEQIDVAEIQSVIKELDVLRIELELLKHPPSPQQQHQQPNSSAATQAANARRGSGKSESN